MPKLGKNGRGARFASATKYDAHHTVLSKTYGALADLRRELADSKERVAEREELLRTFSACTDSQRAWLVLEDYFEKLSLSRKDFTNQEWWPRLMMLQGKSRLEELATRSAHEQELFPPEDWEFIRWLSDTYNGIGAENEELRLSGLSLLQWLARWGNSRRLECNAEYLQFQGQILDLQPHLENGETGHTELSFTQRLAFPDGQLRSLEGARFFAGKPSLVLLNHTFYLLRNTPPPIVLEYWAQKPSIPVKKLSHRLRTQLRKIKSNHGVDWGHLCVAHAAMPQFVFELAEETVRLRLLARSERNQSISHWSGQDWWPEHPNGTQGDKPEILEDSRLDSAVRWLRRLDWVKAQTGGLV